MRLIAILILALSPIGAAMAAGDGCDIATTSYVEMVPAGKHPPKGPRTAGILRALPQTPCPTVPNGCREGEYCNMPIELTISPNPGDPNAAATPQR